jgi:hypothetical protein
VLIIYETQKLYFGKRLLYHHHHHHHQVFVLFGRCLRVLRSVVHGFLFQMVLFHYYVGHFALVLFVFFVLNEGNSTGTVTVSRMKNYDFTESLVNNFIIAPMFQVVYITINKGEC